ncbi:ABC transporter ATP-binding protein [Alteromonas sp. BL110]|uniref:ABC transporter ATP-binding protein n=1 Tax=Alteromonas sp. BL110 TaxID=1714845 RepID=UPI000E4C6C3E|nr:ABC transporter ATP-binding protein [Alteromonas sp. BL110]AXT39667.1 ABC transporter ATP-binding protein [Alteromonas sp. BL110]RKM81846.1 ATP-binding cassette domain-containing protein [Alteromonas sp. BL110]
MLTIKELKKSFSKAGAPLINNLNLTVAPGESVSIQGASGCGKSTLLSLIAGFESPDSGDITVNGLAIARAGYHGSSTQARDIDKFRKQHLGIVFQSFNLFDCFNVWDNIAFTARLKGNFDKGYQLALMKQLEILPLAQKPLSQLSGGEQQRCAIARALVHRPSLILADEPTGNLDETTSETVSDLLFKTCREANTSLVVVTHSQDVAIKADSVLRLHKGVLEDVKPESMTNAPVSPQFSANEL